MSADTKEPQQKTKIERNYSEAFHEIREQNYYTIPKQELNHIHFGKLAQKGLHDIYILKQFKDPSLQAIFEADMTENQRYYAENGYLIVRGLIPDEIVDDYQSLRNEMALGRGQMRRGGHCRHEEMKRLLVYKPMMDIIRELHGAEMGLIFSLSAFSSTQRGWHQDAYLDRDDAIPRLATWIACGDVTAECGPFEYVPKSHRWMTLSNQNINNYVKPEYRWPETHRTFGVGDAPRWGRMVEAFVDPSVYSKIERDNAEIRSFTAKKGDVLFWYGRTMHRGSPPQHVGAERPGIIGHYAPIFERERGYFGKTADGCRYLVPPEQYDLIPGYEAQPDMIL